MYTPIHTHTYIHTYSPSRPLIPAELSENRALTGASEALRSSILVRCHDDGVTPTLFLAGGPEGGQPAGMDPHGWGRVLYPAANHAFAAAFQSAPDIIDASIRYRTPAFILLALCVCGMMCVYMCEEMGVVC